MVKTDYKNLTGFLTTKELNRRQVRQAEMLTEYYFEIQYTKGIDNARVDALSRKAKLQNDEKLLGAILRKDEDRLVRYNYPKLAVIKKSQIYKLPESNQTQRIQEAQIEDLDVDQYKNREVTYILRSIAKEFISEFHKGII